MKKNKDNNLMDNYRTLHQQGFIPIFVSDNYDNRRLVRLLVEAGFKALEYTLRCDDAAEMIPWIRKNYPDLILLVGSTIDSDKVVSRLHQKNGDDFLSLDDLAKMGVHGFVSMLRFKETTFKKFASTHLLIPSVHSVNEAIDQFEFGAHFLKILGNDLSLLELCSSPPTFGFCPAMVTGGMNLERIPQAVESGAAIIGSGFDVIFNQRDTATISDQEIIDGLKSYRETVEFSTRKKFPDFSQKRNGSNSEWLSALPHQHPFFDK